MTTIHKLNKTRTHCSLCRTAIPKKVVTEAGVSKEVPVAAAGEYVGVVTGFKYTADGAYRIGLHNKNSLCNGARFDTFAQADTSVPPAIIQ